MVVALSAFVGGAGLFCGAVFELGVVLALSFSSVRCKVLVASILTGCCSVWPLMGVVGHEEFGGESASFASSSPFNTPRGA